MTNWRNRTLLYGCILWSASFAVRAADANPCLTPLRAEMYRDGWVDFNKNGVRDPYENPAVEIEARVTDLLGRMTMEEKTAQMVTLYGYPRVLKDELPTPAWKTNLWKDGIGNVDEHANGNEGITKPLPRPKNDLPWSQSVRTKNEVQKFLWRKRGWAFLRISPTREFVV